MSPPASRGAHLWSWLTHHEAEEPVEADHPVKPLGLNREPGERYGCHLPCRTVDEVLQKSLLGAEDHVPRVEWREGKVCRTRIQINSQLLLPCTRSRWFEYLQRYSPRAAHYLSQLLETSGSSAGAKTAPAAPNS